MDSITDKKRKLPRHVDGRIMVGPIHIKNFFILLPIAALMLALIIKYFTPPVFFIGFIFLGILISLFSEFQQRETGFSIIKSVIAYMIEGDKFYERNTLNVKIHKKFIRNKISKK
jgi:hypothetical protein